MMEIQDFLDTLVLQPGDVLAIDGRCGAGKTTLAQAIAQKMAVSVVHMDHFFLPPDLRTPARLAEPGGNVHYERILQQVFAPLAQGQAVAYGRFDCQSQQIAELLTVDTTRPIVVEGSYSLRPELRPYYTHMVWLEVDGTTQGKRILQRNGELGLQQFQQRWIPLEEAYFAHYQIAQHAHVVLNGSGAY